MVTEKEVVQALLTLKRLADEANIDLRLGMRLEMSPTYFSEENYTPHRQLFINGTKVAAINMEKVADAGALGIDKVFLPEQ